MKIQYMLPGLAIAAVGFLVLFGLLASVSALAKSKQLGALGALSSGKAGAGKRVLFFIALVALVGGACGVFGGVAASDGERANACTQLCVSSGYAEGKIGAATQPDPKHPVPACKCSGGANAATPFEKPADTLTF